MWEGQIYVLTFRRKKKVFLNILYFPFISDLKNISLYRFLSKILNFSIKKKILKFIDNFECEKVVTCASASRAHYGQTLFQS